LETKRSIAEPPRDPKKKTSIAEVRTPNSGAREISIVPLARLLIALCFLTAVSAFPLACRSPQPSPSMARADAAHAEGVSHLRAGDRAAALARFNAAVAATPLHVAAHRERQNLRLQEREAAPLHREYEELLERFPQSAEAHYLFGRILYRDDDRLAAFQRARDLDPKLAWAHHAEAFVLDRMGKSAAADAASRLALGLEPENPSFILFRSEILTKRGAGPEAEGLLRSALERDPGALGIRIALARRLQSRQRALEALDHWEEVLRQSPREAEARTRLLSLALGRAEEPEGYLAWRLLENLAAAAEGPVSDFDPELAFALARVRHRRGLHDGAQRSSRQVLKAEPRGPEVLRELREWGGLSLPELFRRWSDALGIDLGPANPRIHALARALSGWEEGRGKDVELVRALRAAGWIDEALALALRRAESSPARAAELASEVAALRAHRRFMAELALFAREEREGAGEADPAEELTEFLARIRARLERRTGLELDAEESIQGFAFLGEVLDLTERGAGTLNGYLDQFNQILVAGRWAGEPPQLMLATLAAPPRHERPDDWPDDFGFVEILAERVHIAPPDSLELGRAFFRAYYVNLDRVAASARQRSALGRLPEATKRRLLSERGLAAAGIEERRSLDDPLDTSAALLLRALELHPELPLLGHVRAHEVGHVRDAAERLPVGANFVSNLLLAIEAGFSADRLGGILEETAQLHALREGPSPHLALSDIVDFLPRSEGMSFHHRGYRNLLDRFLAVLDEDLDDFPAIRRDRVLLHQLHHLSEAEIREISRRIRH
jgi:tetratricopeptide (TPR) repeat protein